MLEEKKNSKSTFEQIELHEKQLDLIYNTVTDVIYMIDVEPGGRFKFTSVNQSFLRTTGLKEYQVIGKYLDEVIPPPSLELVLGKYLEAINTAKTVRWEETSVYPAGTKYGLVTVTPVFDQAGVCIRMVGSVHDITENKEKDIEIKKISEEREEMISQLAKRNKDLEQYTYVVSHNLRAPVVNIIGLSEVLSSVDLGTNDALRIIKDLSECVKKLDDVIIDLNYILQIGQQKNTERKELIDLQLLIDDIKLSIANLIRSERVIINFHCEIGTGLYSVRSHIYSVLYNLILNSIKYCKPAVSPVIHIECVQLADNVQITVADNGKGIELEKYGEQIFGFYKRFDTSVKGKGLGLFLVKTQVEDLDGSITVESQLNVGTRFTILLPADSKLPDEAPFVGTKEART